MKLGRRCLIAFSIAFALSLFFFSQNVSAAGASTNNIKGVQIGTGSGGTIVWGPNAYSMSCSDASTGSCTGAETVGGGGCCSWANVTCACEPNCASCATDYESTNTQTNTSCTFAVSTFEVCPVLGDFYGYSNFSGLAFPAGADTTTTNTTQGSSCSSSTGIGAATLTLLYSCYLAQLSPTPSNGSYLAQNYFTVNTTYNTTTSLSWCLLSVNGGANQSMTVVSTAALKYCYVNQTSQSDGNYSYLVYANNSANQWNVTYNRTVVLDTSPPTAFTAVSPTETNNTWLTRNYWSANFTFTDNSPSACLLEINGTLNVSPTASSLTGTNNYCFFNRTSQSDGNYSYKLYANDSVGNWNASIPRNLSIDTVTPTAFTFVSPTDSNDSIVVRDYFYVNATFTELNPNNCILETNHLNGTLNNVSMSISGTNCFVNKTSLFAKNYTYKVYANDSAGNINASFGRQISLENFTTMGNVTNSSTLSIDGVNSTSDRNFSVSLTFRNYGYARMVAANISFVNVTWFDGSNVTNWTVQPSMQECGNISIGSACSKTFYAIIPAGTGNRTNIARIYWNGTWKNNDATDGWTIGNNTRMTIAPNTVLTLNATRLNSTLSPRVSNLTALNLTSAGNIFATNVNVTAQAGGGNLNTSWVRITNNLTTTINANDSVLVTVNVTPGVGTTPGQYNGYLNATSTEGGYVQIPLNLTVQSNGTWSYELATTFNKSFGLSENGSITSFYVNNTGNVPMNFTVNCTAVDDTYVFVSPCASPINISVAAQSTALVNVTLDTGFEATAVRNFTLFLYANESVAEPSSNSTLFYINVTDNAPRIRSLSLNTSFAEVNQTFLFDAFIQDDLGVNNQSIFFNVTFPNGTVLNYSPSQQVVQQNGNQSGYYKLVHFYLDFATTAQQGDNYSVRLTLWDNANQLTTSNVSNSSQASNFSVIGFTNVSITLNTSNYSTNNITNASGRSFAFLLTLNNSGNATAYGLNLSVANATAISASAWNYSVANVSNFAAGAGTAQQLNLSIAAATAPSQYNFTVNASWRQANGSLAFNTSVVSINVTANKSMNLSDYTADYLVVAPGSSGQANFTLNNLGNTNITSTNLSCSGSYCETFNVAFNVSQSLNQSGGNSTPVYFTASVPSGTATGYYPVTINATSDSMNSSFTVTVQVPDFNSWTVLNPESRSLSISGVAGQTSSNSETRVRNLGNIAMNFTFNLSGNITSFMSLNGSNSSTATLGAITSSTNTTNATLNWTVPNATATYTGNLTISNGTEQTNVSITFNAFILTLNITYPLPSNQATNLTAGQNLSINATLVLGATNITTNSTFNATLSNQTASQACPVTNTAVVGSVWTMKCTMPSLLDGKTYNLTLLLNYSSGTANISINATSLNSVKFRDVTSPSISNSSTPTVTWGSGGTIQMNWTDNDALKWANTTVYYPNNTVLFQSPYSSANASFPNLTISFSAAELFAVGDYKVTINASDLSNNTNNTLLFFEVFNATTINGTALDAGGSALSVNYSFYRPGTATALVQNNTNASGGFNLNLSKREYDVNVSISQNTYVILLRNASINASTTAIADLDVVPATGISVTGAKVLQAVALQPKVQFTNATVIINYSSSLTTLQAYGYSQEYLFLFRCGSWNVSSRSCSGNFSLVANTTNSSTNKALDTVFNATTSLYTVNVSNFSAYALVAGRAGDGVCRADLGETCVNSGDCTCEINASTGTNTTIINTVYTSSGGGGGGVSGEPGLVEELNLLREQNKKLSNVTREEVDSLKKRLSSLENRTQLDDKTIAELQVALNKTKEELGISTAAQNIYIELYHNEATQASVHVRNPRNAVSTIFARGIGAIEGFLEFDKQSIDLAPGAEADFKLIVRVPAGTRPGSYNGQIELSQENVNATIPIQIRVLESKERLIDLKIQPLSEVVAPGRTLRTEINIYNLGESKRIDANLKVQILDPSSETVLQEIEDQVSIETTVSTIKALEIPRDSKDGKYIVRAIASYAATANRTREATSLAYFNVQRTIWDITILGLPVWFIATILAAIGLVSGFYYYEKREAERKRRYLEKIDFTKLPTPGGRSGFIGKIAETHVGAFVELDRLTMHTLIAGATGSGKTVAAQVLIEEALKKGISVVVFDPTAQWTGFLRAQRNKEMIAQYKDFNMSPSEAQAFKGNIHVVKNPNDEIDVKKLLKPGEITVFVLNKLKQTSEPVEAEAAKAPAGTGTKEALPEQIDFVLEHLKTEAKTTPARPSAEGGAAPSQIELFVANTVNRVFESNLDESKQLRMILVYDEVHRLLPKFGGSGLGFNQIERGVREFRKWGIGLVLVSQVLSDFVGEIKANIGTEMQMRTKYEDDLERIRQKYGDETLKSVVRSGVGVGMVQNSEYNRGAPYFVNFRPLLHNVTRLSDAELGDYETYNEKIQRFEKDAEALKARKIDVFDVELELDLARDKLKKGAFNIVDIYMESIEQKLNKAKK